MSTPPSPPTPPSPVPEDAVLESALSELVTNPSAATFRVQDTAFMLTYRGHLDKDAYAVWFKNGTGQRAFRNSCTIVIAHEVGRSGETPYDHSHVLIWSEKRFSSVNVRIFDYEGVHPHFSRVHKQNRLRVLNYIAKEDPAVKEFRDQYVAGQQADKESLASKVWSYDTAAEMLDALCTKASDAQGLMCLWNVGKAQSLAVEPIPLESMSPWQEFAHGLLTGNHLDNRSFHWFYDPVGNMGKSFFSRVMLTNYPKECLVLTDVGAQRDLAQVVRNSLAGGCSVKFVICDLPRSAIDYKIYNGLERLKDGILTSVKYSGTTVFLPHSPKLVIMSNFLPEVASVSLDRWKIYQLERSGGEDASVTLIRRIPLSALPTQVDPFGHPVLGARTPGLLRAGDLIELGPRPLLRQDADAAQVLIDLVDSPSPAVPIPELMDESSSSSDEDDFFMSSLHDGGARRVRTRTRLDQFYGQHVGLPMDFDGAAVDLTFLDSESSEE